MPVRVLLIEDNADHVLLTKKILEKAHGGYLLDASPDANDGLRRILEEDYDLVLCDYRLPDSTALDILREMRKKGRDMPFVVVTSMGNVQTGVDLMREGASDYLLKDLSYEKVLPLVIERSIGRYKAIEENKKMSEALKISEMMLRSVVSAAPVGIAIGLNRVIRWVNDYFSELTGYPREELIDKSIRMFYETEEECDRVDKEFYKELREKGVAGMEVRWTHKDGRRLDIYLNGSVMEPQDISKGIVFTIMDITERKRIEDKLKDMLSQQKAILDNIPDIAWLKDNESRFIAVNEPFARARGFKVEEIVGKTDLDVWPKELAERYRSDDREVVKSGKCKRVEEPLADKEGKTQWIETIKTPILDEKGQVIGTAGIARDITERKRAEEELRVAYKKLRQTQQELIQTSKMAAMGQLAAGISHELNQPLTGIKGFTQAVLADLEKESPFRNDLNKIVEQVDRIDTIIKNVRFFARKSDFNMVELDINHVVSDSLMLLNQQLKTCNIRVIQELGLGIPKMQGDHNQLQQAFLNIISNARDAILNLNRPEGGEIRIRTLLSQDKNHLEITFQDTGCGIPEENLQHIFSPFYTTKSPDRGMGLGLSITYRIIENHQGKIEFQTKAGEGTIFRIVLPVKETKHKIKQS